MAKFAFRLAFLVLLSVVHAYPHPTAIRPRNAAETQTESTSCTVPGAVDHTGCPSDVAQSESDRSAAQMGERDLIGGAAHELATLRRLLGLDTAGSEDGSMNGVCSDVIVVFARGTGEAAPLGIRVGPPFRDALQAMLGPKTMSFIGVDYPADLLGYLEGGSPKGSAKMAWVLTNAAILCPNASIVSSGYSQGAQLVHKSAMSLDPVVTTRINAVVTFGDPDNRSPVQGVPPSATYIVCHPLDEVCFVGDLGILDIIGIPFILLSAPEHLNYAKNVGDAAAFVAALV